MTLRFLPDKAAIRCLIPLIATESIATILGRKIELSKINFELVRPLFIKRADSCSFAFPRIDLVFLDLLWRCTSSTYLRLGRGLSFEWACECAGKLRNKTADRGSCLYCGFLGDRRCFCPFGGSRAGRAIQRFA